MQKIWRKTWWAGILLLLALPAVQAAAGGAARPVFDEDGEEIFQEKCAACHSIGGGDLVGPDLMGVTSERDRDWLVRWISAPDEMLAEGDPIAADLLSEFNNLPMPNLGLSESEAAAVVAYLAEASGEEAAAEPVLISEPVNPIITSGNPENGRLLFMGGAALANGGPQCASCHSVAGIAALGGGTLGPDLTGIQGRLGDAGLAAALQGLPFPTMQGIFGQQPLTDQEAADLFAFLAQADQSPTGGMNFTFVWIGLGGALVFILLSQLIWRKRFTGVRQSLVGR